MVLLVAHHDAAYPAFRIFCCLISLQICCCLDHLLGAHAFRQYHVRIASSPEGSATMVIPSWNSSGFVACISPMGLDVIFTYGVRLAVY
jgi:hypothetical protein